MYNKFCVAALDFSAVNKSVSVVFNKDIDEETVGGGAVKLSSSDGKALGFSIDVSDETVTLNLDEWPDASSEYWLVIDKTLSDIAGNTLGSIFRKKIRFPEEITSITTIKSPYNFQKLDTLALSVSDSDGIGQYYIEISDNNNFYDCVYKSEIYTGELVLEIPSMQDGQYYVRACCRKDGSYGPWSKTVTFVFRYACDDDEPKSEGPSADAEMPSAWEKLYSGTAAGQDPPAVEIEDDLELICCSENGETPTEFVFKAFKDLDPYSGEVVIIKKEF